MRAMILAAGRGERLRPLTDTTPKPLVEAGGKPLIAWHLEALAAAGFGEVVINVSHLCEQIETVLGDGETWGLQIRYSQEPPGALETGGGIQQALPLLGNGPFLVVNGDIWTDFPLAALRAVKSDYAHLVLVPPPDHSNGDFCLNAGRIANHGEPLHTFSGIAVYHPRMFRDCAPGRYSVVPLLQQTIDNHLVTGELHTGRWFDAGTPERLQTLGRFLEQRD
jgi:MurNAc alpha-1-phosphate uridylyltransferase